LKEKEEGVRHRGVKDGNTLRQWEGHRDLLKMATFFGRGGNGKKETTRHVAPRGERRKGGGRHERGLLGRGVGRVGDTQGGWLTSGRFLAGGLEEKKRLKAL